ncbi:Transcription initiation factor TFIID subunit 10 [Rhizophlyctis rosea]|uniref:Transcription initiation factor TFIID subunit 10 n=1 Tax=Rhizophlyctis rosea TaxID=64517 RepID=A0AAD5SFU2_9FUNG|nr:Transcription initiation factor TFIID subunit 10 [Rhizophlyctis rosea]
MDPPEGKLPQASEQSDEQSGALPEAGSGDRKGKGPVLDETPENGEKRKRDDVDESSMMDEDQAGNEDGANAAGDDGPAQDRIELEESPKRRKTKRELDALRKERNLADLLLMMDEFQPLIPDAVTDYYLARSGFDCEDVRLKRLLALAAQKFVADIANDALHYSKIRAQQIQAKDRKGAHKDKRNVLTMDDLSNALAEHGVNIKKPEYFV